MAEAKDSLLTVRFETTGKELTAITDWEINSSYITSTDGFSFTAFDSDPEALANLEMQPVELLVNGCSQVLGRIDTSEVGGNGTAWTFHGRDYIADLLECNVDPLVKIKDGDSIAAAFTEAFGPVGIDTVISDDDIAMRNVRTGIAVKVGKGGRGYAKRLLNEYKPRKGEGAYEFGSRLVARFGATLQPGNDRSTLVIGSPRYDQEPVSKIFRSRDPKISQQNNVQTSQAIRDFSSFPTFAMFAGWAAKNDTAGSNSTQEYDINKVVAEFSDELTRILADSTVSGRRKPGASDAIGLGQLYRLLYFRDDEARTQEQLRYSALRAVSERLKNTLQYNCTLKGHVDLVSGAVWSIDTMVQVEDEICRVSEPLWVAERTLKYSSSEGATTDLVCYRPSSFQFGHQ